MRTKRVSKSLKKQAKKYRVRLTIKVTRTLSNGKKVVKRVLKPVKVIMRQIHNAIQKLKMKLKRKIKSKLINKKYKLKYGSKSTSYTSDDFVYSKIYEVYIDGWGCGNYIKNYKNTTTDSTRKYICNQENENIDNHNISNLELCCKKDMKTGLGVRNLVSEIAKIKFKKLKTKFVMFMKNKIDKLLSSTDKIILITGHSFGGSVVTRLARLYETEQNKNIDEDKYNRLFFMTSGSIYILPVLSDYLKNRIIHIIYEGDIALKINNIKKTDKDMKNVCFIPLDTSLSGISKSMSVHNLYHNINNNFTKKRKNVIKSIINNNKISENIFDN